MTRVRSQRGERRRSLVVDDKRPYALRGAVFSPNIRVKPDER